MSEGNANWRAGEDRISPHEITPFFTDPQVIRSICYSIANILPMIRDDWMEGDAIYGEWTVKGWSTIGDSFLSKKKSARYEIDRLLNKITSDLGVVVLPHFDPSLRDRLVQFVQNARPYEYTNVHGDRGERWHLSWDELGLDDEIAFLESAIRAFGDSYAIQNMANKQIVEPAESLDDEADADLRPAGWFSKATDRGLYADLLRVAMRDGRLVGSQKVAGRWHHSTKMVAGLYPEYRTSIETALADESGA